MGFLEDMMRCVADVISGKKILEEVVVVEVVVAVAVVVVVLVVVCCCVSIYTVYFGRLSSWCQLHGCVLLQLRQMFAV